MTHFHVELIMPPVPKEDIEEAIDDILAPYRSGAKNSDPSIRGLWDYWDMGGRYDKIDKPIVTRLADCPKNVTAYTVMIAFDGQLLWMVERATWNGCNSVPIDWDGQLDSAIEMFHASPYAREIPDDSLVVTLDFHI